MARVTWSAFALGAVVVACSACVGHSGAYVGEPDPDRVLEETREPDLGSAVPLGSRSIWAGVYTGEQADRGDGLYSRSCSRCHGRELRGGEDAPPLKGNAFLRWWSGKPLGELDELIRMDMPADNPGGLNGRQYTDVLTYLLRENDYPAGEEPLSEDPEELAEIMIEAEGGGE